MTESLLGTKVGHYRIVDRLAAGGMGEVYVGHDETLQRRVALKRIRPEFHLSELAKARFQREARVLSQLGHPNICQIHDYLEGEESDFIVMELVEGRRLTEAMKAGLDVRTKARVAEQVAGVLVAAHGKGVVHRDLKPDNVMLAAGGQVKVLDFGLSRELGDQAPSGLPAPARPEDAEIAAGEFEEAATRSSVKARPPATEAGSEANLTTVGTVMGTVGYMSPEQARGEAATAASDIYAFGLMLQELFTGRRAYEAGLKGAALMEKAKKGETLPATGIDKDLAALIGRLKSVEPAARPSAIDVAEKLEWIRRKPQRRRRRMAWAAGFVALAAGLAVVGSLWLRAVKEVRQREAAQLLSLGRLRLNDHPNAALAYAIASLEKSDNDPARRFAVEALAQGPSALFLRDKVDSITPCWSPDGDRLAIAGPSGLEIVDREKGEERQLTSTFISPVWFTSDGRRLLALMHDSPKSLQIWTLPEGRLERTLELPQGRFFNLQPPHGNELLTCYWDETKPEAERTYFLHLHSLDGTSDRLLGGWAAPKIDWDCDIDPDLRWLVFWQGGRVFQRGTDDLSAPPRFLGTQEADWVTVTIGSWRDRAVTSDEQGNVRIWYVPSGTLERTIKSPASAHRLALDPTGKFLATGPGGSMPPRTMFLFDLTAPSSAEAAPLICGESRSLDYMGFSPDGSRLATTHNGVVVLWDTSGRRPTLLGRQKPPGVDVAFASDDQLLSSSEEGILRRWPLSFSAGHPMQVLWSKPGAWIGAFWGGVNLAVDRTGRFAIMAEGSTHAFHIVPLDGSPASTHTLMNPQGLGSVNNGHAALDPSGRWVAMYFNPWSNPESRCIRVFDLATGNERTLDTHPKTGSGWGVARTLNEGMACPAWLPDGRLVTDGDAGLLLWDLSSGTSRLLRRSERPLTSQAALGLMATPDGRSVVRINSTAQTGFASWLSVFDMDSSTTREITSHGQSLTSFALDPTGTIIVTGDLSGVVRVGRLTGDEPHLLYGHAEGVTSVAVSPDGKWIASGGEDGTIRLWPMPDLSKPPLHTLPHDELLAKLKALTNLRAVRDPKSDTGWKIEIGPFTGWAHVPEWQP